ncbi:hypothetical protein [Methanobacterium petrolearium]|uniref:hypothetical protein n=1 Tax=Methanobacterium petrolearium TaxID=710190 RepID=UPI001AE79B1A|nr:hypothetical protein [Methanobacterium petrolearium]MBP1946521.1 vacuolar-type H+-ATPase subunit I/STV1 [Methanobacterium petrolearium]BDZ69865.1 hypothetical protein GCM10025861_03820 [Methanobacterium petrolearium]
MIVDSSMELWSFYIAAIIGIGNILLLVGLFYIYWQNYKEIKSKFNLGLIFFATFLLLQSLFLTLSILFHGGFGRGVGVLLAINNLILFIALSILLKITI